MELPQSRELLLADADWTRELPGPPLDVQVERMGERSGHGRADPSDGNDLQLVALRVHEAGDPGRRLGDLEQPVDRPREELFGRDPQVGGVAQLAEDTLDRRVRALGLYHRISKPSRAKTISVALGRSEQRRMVGASISLARRTAQRIVHPV